MPRQTDLIVSPRIAGNEEALGELIRKRLRLMAGEMAAFRILRRSMDARAGHIRFHLRIEIFGKGEKMPGIPRPAYRNVHRADPVHIVGAGPAGLFCALRLIELGIKPVVIERGCDVSQRKKDVAKISREHLVNPDSNYCFGEGGAGTFSDGKLYTRSKKRGNTEKILQVLYLHGAPEQILYDAHPHIGTDRLPQVVKAIRETILGCGGEVWFNTRLRGLDTSGGKIRALDLEPSGKTGVKALVLATGHSARDVYSLLNEAGIPMDRKGFAMGVRVEHPQGLIDEIQYHGRKTGQGVPPASYSLAVRAGSRGVYSFCMCPGGFMVPSATGTEEVVLNGMSPLARNSPYANSGIVAEIREEDLAAFGRHGLMAGLRFQEWLERQAWEQGGKTQKAPAQRLTDFLENRPPAGLPAASYFPGLAASSLHEWLPPFLKNSLQEAFRLFDRKMKGFVTAEALIAGVESRTSSPLRILRDDHSGQAPGCTGLFPCGEGSGYAGGILSSAMDGERTAGLVWQYLSSRGKATPSS